jgi:histone deacetylase HOS3
LKKVTLKLGSREEHDRKMKERLDSERRARALKGAETRRINKAARDAKVAESKVTPAQRAKVGPSGGTTEVPIAAIPKHVPEPLDFAHLSQGPSSSIQPLEISTSQAQFAQAAMTASPQVNNAQTPYEATTSPPFNMPTYDPSPATQHPPQQAAEPPAATLPPLQSLAFPPQSIQQFRESSESSPNSFVPGMETAPPSSRPAVSFPENLPPAPAVESFQSSQTLHEERPTLPDHATNYPDVAVDYKPRLPVFSATGPIPFADMSSVPVGQHQPHYAAPAATGGQSGDEASTGAADSHVWQAVNRPTE